MKPYCVISDVHAHAWSAFSATKADSINNRLGVIVAELERAAKELRDAGGDTIVFAGDLFHQRGSIDPEVFNPVHDAIKRILLSGVSIVAIPGNHDLKGRDCSILGNAFQTFSALPGFEVVTERQTVECNGHTFVMVPWRSTHAQLLEDLQQMSDLHDDRSDLDVFIHAGIDGVLSGVPASGLTAKDLEAYGFGRVFAGHYHNHKIMSDGVISIGATTHQTWSDVGTKAGYLLVYPDRIDYRASHAPSFVDVTPDTDPDEIPLIVDGNYVRVRDMKLADADINKFRDELTEMGAKGASIQVERQVVSARTGATAAKATTLRESIGKYVASLASPDEQKILGACDDILTTVQSVAA